jgi:RNA polymerase sigma-70 factor (ECF subfamily)
MRVLSNLSDQELVKSYLSGDSKAFQVLLEKHQSKIFGYIFSKVKNYALADDIFQEVFIKVVNNLNANKYNEEGKFLPWVMRISHNKIIDHFRKSNKTTMVRDGDTYSIFEIIPLELENSIEDVWEKEQTLKQMKNAIKQLAPNQQRVVEKRIFCEMSFQEIAEEENISINTALGRMRYAIINLRKLMSPIESA